MTTLVSVSLLAVTACNDNSANDLMSWTQLSSGVVEGNVLIPNVKEKLDEALKWAQTDTLWAPDVIQLADGKYYMYYNACKGDSPLSALGIAMSDNIEGPYKNKGVILKSGMAGIGDDGEIYDATQKPNVVDPDVFFDKEGKLWMVYGSYSGGIFIMELNASTGFPLPDQDYGKKLLGANHARIEAPYMLYSPETDYYYLFLSYGGWLQTVAITSVWLVLRRQMDLLKILRVRI